MASSPAQPWLYGGTFLFLLATIFLISAAAVPRFGVVTVASTASDYNVPVSGSITIGAFSMCVEIGISVLSSSQCGAVDGSCKFTIGNTQGTVPYCGTFNAFRGFLVTALILTGLAVIAALAHTCQASPNPNIAHFTFVATLFAAVGSAISLVCWLSWASASDVYAGLSGSASDPSVTGTYASGPSLYLLVSAMVAVLLGLVIWLYGRLSQMKAGASAMGAVPHYHSAPAHYSGDVQLNQPLTQH